MIVYIISILIILFAIISLRVELNNYTSKNNISKARRRIIICFCLIAEGILITIGNTSSLFSDRRSELVFWGFGLILLIPIIWLAWKDLKSSLLDLEKSEVENVRKIIDEIKKDVNNKSKLRN